MSISFSIIANALCSSYIFSSFSVISFFFIVATIKTMRIAMLNYWHFFSITVDRFNLILVFVLFRFYFIHLLQFWFQLSSVLYFSYCLWKRSIMSRFVICSQSDSFIYQPIYYELRDEGFCFYFAFSFIFLLLLGPKCCVLYTIQLLLYDQPMKCEKDHFKHIFIKS